MTHSDTGTLRRCLTAISDQTRPVDSVVLVANGSPDLSAIRGVVRSVELNDIQLVELPCNSGAAGGFAAGISHVASTGSADAICCFDDDAIPDRGCVQALEVAVEAAERSGISVGCVGALTQCSDQELSWPLYRAGASQPINTVAEASSAASEVGLISAYALSWHALLVPVATVGKVGNVWAELFHQYEDAEFGLRIRSAGLHNLVSVNARCVHPSSPSTKRTRVLGRDFYHGANSPAKEYLNVRNSILVRRRHDGVRFWFRSLPEILVRAYLAFAQQSGNRLGFLSSVIIPAMVDAALGRTGPPPDRLGPL